jgi:predicted DCC family thiol-disulfide oxidoreductase YuxK
MGVGKPLNIIYDGHCGFCRRSLRFVLAFDWRHALRFHDARQLETMERFPELQETDLGEAMYAVVNGEPIYCGFFAFRRMIWSNPTMWLLIPLFYFPGATFFGPQIYAWVATHRSRFGCHSEVCELPSRLDGQQLRRSSQSTQS